MHAKFYNLWVLIILDQILAHYLSISYARFFASILFWPFSLRSHSKKPCEQTRGREVHEIFTLLKSKVIHERERIKRVQNHTHVVFDRPYCQVLVVTNVYPNKKQNIRAERTMSKQWYRVKKLYEIFILYFWSKPRNTHSL